MTKVRVMLFEGPMCCSSGLCGPSPDPSLIGIQNTTIQLEKEFKDTVEVVRANIIANLDQFLENRDVYEEVTKKGLSALPIVKVNGNIIAEGEYPTFEMLKNEVLKTVGNG
jgi:hypothetical protein